MSRSRRRKIILIGVLVALLALMTVMFVNYRASRRFGFGLDLSSSFQETAPEYLFSFSGPDANKMMKPTGLLVDGGNVYVTDVSRQSVDVYDLQGRYRRSIGKGKISAPLYIAKSPKDGLLYVTDRRRRSIEVFDTSGKWIRTFDPALPKKELPTFETQGAEWAPVGVAFAPNGTMYVTEILKGHRLVVFGPDGKFKRSVGTAAFADKATDNPEGFQFPNAILVLGKEVWVADSNNRRMQVFDQAGNFLRLVPTDGLPRGIVSFRYPLAPRAVEASEATRLAVADTLSHDVTLFNPKGEQILRFGSQGVLEGQFSYPNDIAVDRSARIFVADTGNSRVQVWGWPQLLNPIPTPDRPMEWLLCLSPLLLLPLLLLLRKRRFVATPDFLSAVVAAGHAGLLPEKRRVWVALEQDMEAIRAIVLPEDGRSLLDIVEITPEEHSASDAAALVDRLEIDQHSAALLALAGRIRRFGNVDMELRRLAQLLDIPTFNAAEFVEQYGRRRK